MPDLDTRFRDLKRSDPPDLWSAIETRAAAPVPRTGRRWAIVALASAIGVAGVMVVVLAFRGTGPRAPAAPPTVTTTPTPPATSASFVPPTERIGGREVVRVSFPDGTTATVSYPAELALAAGGVRPWNAAGIDLDGETCCPRSLVMVYGDGAGFLSGAGPVRRYPGADGDAVELWEAADPSVRYYLRFRFGPWSVLVFDGNDGNEMTEGQRATWARTLSADVTPDGFLVLHARAPLFLGRASDNLSGGRLGEGPHLSFGDLDPRFVLLFPGACDAGALVTYEPEEEFANFCDVSGTMTIHVYGEAAYLNAVRDGLRIEDVGLAS